MGPPMKITVDIEDALLLQVKHAAKRDGTTLKALVEAGLRELLAEQVPGPKPLRLRQASFKGSGLRRELAGAAGRRLREMACEDPGSAVG